jgi:hypothetical protein
MGFKFPDHQVDLILLPSSEKFSFFCITTAMPLCLTEQKVVPLFYVIASLNPWITGMYLALFQCCCDPSDEHSPKKGSFYLLLIGL